MFVSLVQKAANIYVYQKFSFKLPTIFKIDIILEERMFTIFLERNDEAGTKFYMKKVTYLFYRTTNGIYSTFKINKICQNVNMS